MDANGPPADAQLCFGSFVRVCFDSAADLPTEARHWGDDGNDAQIDTDVASVCDQHNDQKAGYCVITGAGMTFAQTKTFIARGSKPLVLLSTSAVRVEGTIDVSGELGNAAGANPVGQCTGATPAMGNSGGAGGSFAGRGGNGGQVNAPAGSSIAAPRLNGFPSTLRGGCSGQAGDKTDSPATFGGSGGGAVAIIAPSLSLDGAIIAPGSGGSGGPTAFTGGGGGGSGGMIVLDVPMAGMVRGPNAILVANGGGGGEGGDGSSAGSSGFSSAVPTPAAPGGGTPEAGGGNFSGGNGGDGSAGAEIDGSASPGGVQNGGGGGGGGGGAGFVHAPGITGDSVISPASLDLPATFRARIQPGNRADPAHDW